MTHRSRPQGVNIGRVDQPGEAFECCDPHCSAPVVDGSPVPICTTHYVAVIRHYTQTLATMGIGYNDPLVDSVPAEFRPVKTDDRQPVVYFIAMGSRVKIGTTRNLPNRLKQLPFEEILAVIPGDAYVERRWHDRYAQYRTRGEWFDLPADVIADVRNLGIAA